MYQIAPLSPPDSHHLSPRPQKLLPAFLQHLVTGLIASTLGLPGPSSTWKPKRLKAQLRSHHSCFKSPSVVSNSLRIKYRILNMNSRLPTCCPCLSLQPFSLQYPHSLHGLHWPFKLSNESSCFMPQGLCTCCPSFLECSPLHSLPN